MPAVAEKNKLIKNKQKKNKFQINLDSALIKNDKIFVIF